MSSLVEQPFQIFNDVDGDPLKSGFIFIGVPGLNPETSPVSVFFDSALTVPAAQPIRTIGGYPSNSGTPASLFVATGDYSILVKNKNGTLIYSRLSGNGTAESTAQVANFNTVAEMKAAYLPDGQKARTFGYYAAGDGGGGEYVAATASADGFGDHVLASGNTAVLTVEDRVRASQYGVTNAGVDTISALSAFLTRVASGTPGDVDLSGTYGMSTGAVFSVEGDFDLTVRAGAEFKALAGFPANKKLFQINEGSALGAVFKWVGGSVDGENIPNSGAGEANDLIYFTAESCSSVTIHLDRTFTGADWRTAGADSHVFAVANNLSIDIKEAVGAWDAAVYVSGDSTDSSSGISAKVTGNFYKCENAVVVKRDYQDINVDIYAEDCKNGAGYVDDANVGGVEVVGGDGGFIKVSSRRTERSAFVQGGSKAFITVDAKELGVALTGGTPYTSVNAQALNLEGCDDCFFIVNAHDVNALVTKSSTIKAVNVGDRTVDVTVLTSEDNKGVINCSNIGTALTEGGGSDRNSYEIQDQNPSAIPTYVGANSLLIWIFEGRRIRSYGGALSNSYTAGTKEVVEAGTAQVNIDHVTSNSVQWFIRSGAATPARMVYAVAAGEWQWRANSSGVVFSITGVGPKLPSYTVAGLPAGVSGSMAFASDGRKAGEGAGLGTGVQVFHDGTNWIAVDTGTVVLA